MKTIRKTTTIISSVWLLPDAFNRPNYMGVGQVECNPSVKIGPAKLRKSIEKRSHHDGSLAYELGISWLHDW